MHSTTSNPLREMWEDKANEQRNSRCNGYYNIQARSKTKSRANNGELLLPRTGNKWTIPPCLQYTTVISYGDQKGKQTSVVNRNESYVPPLYVGVCG